MCLGSWRFALGVGGKWVVGVIWGHHRGIGLLWLHWGWVASFWVAGGVNRVSVGMRSCGLFGGVGCCSRPGDIWGWLWFSCGMAQCRGGLIVFFHGFFASIRGVFILAGGLGTRL